jgi:hypothetical protein
MIALTTPYSLTGPNIVIVNDRYAKMTSVDVDFLNQTVTFTFRYGTWTSGGGFVVDPTAPVAMTIQANVKDPANSSWSASAPGFNSNGVLTGAAQVNPVVATITSTQTACQATGEGFVAAGLLPGTYQAG